MTLAAEVGGVAIVLQLLSGLPYRLLLVLAVVGLAIVIWTIKLDWIERIFGYGGLCMLVFAVAAVKLAPDWGSVGTGFIPHLPQNNPVLYLYFVVGLLGAAMTPYEVYFYSSGGVEDGWTKKDLGLNRANAIVGYSLGGLAFARVDDRRKRASSSEHGISPEHLGTIAPRRRRSRSGKIGLLVALVGILFAVGGASIDTVFSGAYNLAQFFGWEWGRYRHPSGAPRFALTWMFLLVAALAIVMTGVDPVMLTEYAVIFSAVALPLTYIPILLVANDRRYMGALRQRTARQHARDRLPRRDPDRRGHRRSSDDPDKRGAELMTQIYLARNVLDHQLLDADGRRCGKVDDLAIEGGPGETARGRRRSSSVPAYWPQRSGRLGRHGRLARRLEADQRAVGRGRARRLRRRAAQPSDRLRTRKRRRPPATDPRQDPGSRPMRTLSSLIGRQVVTASGSDLGSCHDLKAELTPNRLEVVALCVGQAGYRARLGIVPAAMTRYRGLGHPHRGNPNRR